MNKILFIILVLVSIDASAKSGKNPTFPAYESGTNSSDLAPSPAGNRGESFDAVPTDQVEALSIRLKLVAEIIQKHSRAYDYRSLTVRELQTILNRLDAASPTKALPGPPPPQLFPIEESSDDQS